MGQNRGLVSIGIFLIIIVAAIVIYEPLTLIDWTSIPAVVLALYGGWMIILAGIRSSNPRKYERSPFSTFALGLVLVAVGGAWSLYGLGWLYSLATILLVLGVLAIATALKGE